MSDSYEYLKCKNILFFVISLRKNNYFALLFVRNVFKITCSNEECFNGFGV